MTLREPNSELHWASTRPEDNTPATAVAVGHFVQVGIAPGISFRQHSSRDTPSTPSATRHIRSRTPGDRRGAPPVFCRGKREAPARFRSGSRRHHRRGDAEQPSKLLSAPVRIVLDTTILVRANESSHGLRPPLP